MLGIGSDGCERLSHGFEQNAVDFLLVLISDRADLGRETEDDMEVGDRQQLGLARFEPRLGGRPLAFWTMPIATGIIGDPRMRAVLAALDMTAERGRTTNLDRRHDAPLSEAYVAGVGRAPCLTVAAENVRHLQLRPGHCPACVRSEGSA